MFYQFMQNNSGGSFDFDEASGITASVLIEAESKEEANTIAKGAGIYFYGCYAGYDCQCCGDRWYEADDGDARDYPHNCGTPLSEETWGFSWMAEGKECCVHYKDGHKEWYGK